MPLSDGATPGAAQAPGRHNLAGGLGLAGALLAAALWYVRPELGILPLFLIVAAGLAQAWLGQKSVFRPTPFDLPLLLFLLSALLGVWTAYDRATAMHKCWQIIGGLALYYAVSATPERIQIGRRSFAPLRLLLATLPALIALYFMTTTDWARWMGKVTWLDPLMRWFASWQVSLPAHRLHPNVAGGLIAALIPLQVAVLWGHAGWRPGTLRRALAAGLTGLAGLGLLLTASRGAWLALFATATLWWLLRLRAGRAQRDVAGRGRQTTGPVLLWGIVLLLVLALAGSLALPGAWAGRMDLLHNSLDLALDYPITGLGLGGFELAYSSYVLLLHVGHTVHSHNLLLNVWLEQGLAGLLALVWLMSAGGVLAVKGWRLEQARRSGAVREASGLFLPALATLAVILLHGMVDDAFYGSRAVLLLFLPFGVLSQAWQTAAAAETPGGAPAILSARRADGSARFLPSLIWLVSLLLVSAGLLLPGIRAAFQANLGALAQTQLELSRYQKIPGPVQDAVRRASESELEPAMARYRAALALDPGNATANRRLGQIDLSLGRYDVARQYLVQAYKSAPGQRATRQMLGESYAVAGDFVSAAALWATVDLSSGQLETRRWWYEGINDQQRATRIQQAAMQ